MMVKSSSEKYTFKIVLCRLKEKKKRSYCDSSPHFASLFIFLFNFIECSSRTTGLSLQVRVEILPGQLLYIADDLRGQGYDIL